MFGRSGEIQMLPKEPNFVAGGLTHAGPWDYVQDIPMLWYGPGFVEAGVIVDRPVTLADVAPTQAALLSFEGFDAPDGRPMYEALAPDPPLPRLVVLLVWDGAGRDVLDLWPDDWPNLKALIPEGTWFENATVGASPSNTPPSHSTMGTGAFPWRAGVVDEFMRFDGTILKPFDEGPGTLLLPTLADLYDRAMGNAPLVGTIATLDPHVAMMGHGSQFEGGDADLVVERQLANAETGGAEAYRWNLTAQMAPYYSFPAYANDDPGFPEDLRALDARDGALDGKWIGNDIQQLRQGFDTPARVPLETRLVEEVIRREGFGADATPDLLFLNYKVIDTVGHIFSADGTEMQQSLRAQDADLPVLIDALNRLVGEGRWVMSLTADHGHQRDPAITGAFQIGIDQVEAAVTERFDDGDEVPVIQQMRPTQIWLDLDELRSNGHDLSEVASFIMGLTQEDTLKAGMTIGPGHESDLVFSAVFPTTALTQMDCLPRAPKATP